MNAYTTTPTYLPVVLFLRGAMDLNAHVDITHRLYELLSESNLVLDLLNGFVNGATLLLPRFQRSLTFEWWLVANSDRKQ